MRSFFKFLLSRSSVHETQFHCKSFELHCSATLVIISGYILHDWLQYNNLKSICSMHTGAQLATRQNASAVQLRLSPSPTFRAGHSLHSLQLQRPQINVLRCLTSLHFAPLVERSLQCHFQTPKPPTNLCSRKS